MIDIKTGDIMLPIINLKLSSDLTKSLLQDFLLDSQLLLRVDDMKNGYVWYRTKALKFEELSLKFSISFFKERISLIQFSIHDEHDNRSNWNDWSKEIELEQKEKHDRLLSSIINREPDEKIEVPIHRTTFNFSWGYIASLYDDRSASSYIMITYNKP